MRWEHNRKDIRGEESKAEKVKKGDSDEVPTEPKI